MAKPSSSCYLLLIVCLRGSCHSFIHLPLSLASVICRHGCSLISAASPNNAEPHAVKKKKKKSSLSSILHSSLHAVSTIPLSLFCPVLLPLRLISSLFFAPAPPHICIWMSQNLPGLRVVLATCICVRILCVRSVLHHQKLQNATHCISQGPRTCP